MSASAAAALDAGTPDYDSYPVMALIISETRVRERLARLTPVQWAALQDLFASAMDRRDSGIGPSLIPSVRFPHEKEFIMSMHQDMPDKAVLAGSWTLFCPECSQKMRIILAAPAEEGQETRT